MNKKDLATVVVLILLIPVWLWIDRTFVKPLFPEPPPPPATATPAPEMESDPALVEATPAPEAAGETESAPGIAAPAPVETVVEERTFPLRLSGAEGEPTVTAEFSNLGASVQRVTFHQYAADIDSKDNPETNPVVVDFGPEAALALEGAGLGVRAGFQVEPSADGGGMTFTRALPGGVAFRRTVSLDEGYVLQVEDTFQNTADSAAVIPDLELFLGAMHPVDGVTQRFGPFVGVDAKYAGNSSVNRFWKEIRKGLKNANTYEATAPGLVEWFSVKNKYFTQVVTLETGGTTGAEALTVRGKKGEGEVIIAGARPSVQLDGVSLDPGSSVTRSYSYYVGPQSMERLRELGGGQEKIVDMRLWSLFAAIASVLISGLQMLYGLTGNYGVAIILLTFVVRMLIWPLSLKGTENMKKMSQLSPQMKELREKYKSNPQKLNQEMAAFYKKNNVNPMAGCLPMLVQMPIFIGLYGALRGVASDLRFAEFFWINDLSQQEALFSVGGFEFNLLPLTVAASMVFLQKLTPSNVDPQQQKIMAMMPIIFLLFTYSLPSAFMLYMTTSNLVSIYQTTHTRKRDAKRESTQESSAPVKASSSGKKKPVKK